MKLMAIGLCPRTPPHPARAMSVALSGSCLVLTLFGLTAPNLSADDWMFDKGIHQEQFECGEVQVLRVVDATEDQNWPRFWIEVYKDGALAGTLKDLSFEDLAMSPDCNLFLGISNGGVPRSAVILFTGRGELITSIEHSFESGLPYCAFSITIERVWYDADQPNVAFDYSEAGDLEEITIATCSGERFGLGHLLSLPAWSEEQGEVEARPADGGGF